MNTKHPLATQWVVWYDYQEKRFVNMENWSENLHKVCVFGDVESFWAICEEIGESGDLPQSSNLHFFRAGIEPMWEDKANVGGGKWVIELANSPRATEIWQSTLLFCISEISMVMKEDMDFDAEDLSLENRDVDLTLGMAICGAVFSPRRSCFRISIWTSIKDERVLHIGTMWKRFASIPEKTKISFKAHENALKGTRDGTQDLYSI